jgi:hypothetical protein
MNWIDSHTEAGIHDILQAVIDGEVEFAELPLNRPPCRLRTVAHKHGSQLKIGFSSRQATHLVTWQMKTQRRRKLQVAL